MNQTRWLGRLAAVAAVFSAVMVPGAASAGPLMSSEVCKPGYVWRQATPDDHVCVTPAERDQVRSENAQASAHTAKPTGSGGSGSASGSQPKQPQQPAPATHKQAPPVINGTDDAAVVGSEAGAGSGAAAAGAPVATGIGAAGATAIRAMSGAPAGNSNAISLGSAYSTGISASGVTGTTTSMAIPASATHAIGIGASGVISEPSPKPPTPSSGSAGGSAHGNGSGSAGGTASGTNAGSHNGNSPANREMTFDCAPDSYSPCMSRLIANPDSITVNWWPGSNFTDFNVRWSVDGQPDQQVDVGQDHRFAIPRPAHHRAGSTYTVSVQGCWSAIFRHSICSPWDGHTITTVD